MLTELDYENAALCGTLVSAKGHTFSSEQAFRGYLNSLGTNDLRQEVNNSTSSVANREAVKVYSRKMKALEDLDHLAQGRITHDREGINNWFTT